MNLSSSSSALNFRLNNGSFSNMSNATQRYERHREIGRGAYSAVYMGRDRQGSGSDVAMKEVRIRLDTEEGIPMTTIREIGLLRQLDKFEHPNVVRLLDVVSSNRSHRELKLNLIFEHIDQDLQQYLARQPFLESERIQHLFHQILSGVDFIHTHRIVHRDLKPQNILVTADGQVKLADFGLARIYGFSMALTSVVVTLYYRAPEVLLQDQYCAAVDIWSCACIFAELHTRRPLFAGKSEKEQLLRILETIGLPVESEWPDKVSVPWSYFKQLIRMPPPTLEALIPNLEPEAKDLIEQMLTFNQLTRISAHDALQSAYFSNLRDSDPVTAAAAANTASSSESEESDYSVSEEDEEAEEEYLDYADEEEQEECIADALSENCG